MFDATAAVAVGHYRPAHRPLAHIESVAAAHGVHHLVLVQPSVYGSDNTLLLQALQQQPGRHRGVVVLPDEPDDRTLDSLHAAGVRGARLNLVSPVGEGTGDVEARFRHLAPRLRQRGWHLQWYAAPAQLGLIARLHAGSGVTAVLDHLAGLHAELPADGPVWPDLQALADGGAWVKLSGWYRLRATAPYDALRPHIERVVQRFGPRLVWGSDWPHTSFTPDAMPAYGSTWAPAARVLGPDAAARNRQGALLLYGDFSAIRPAPSGPAAAAPC